MSRERKIISAEEFEKKGRRSFLTGLTAAGLGIGGLQAINSSVDRRIPTALRAVHDVNGAIWQGLFREGALEPTFDPSEAEELIFNGRWGVRDDNGDPLPLDLENYRIEVAGPNNEVLDSLTIDQIQALPYEEMTVVHKCVEGWSQKVTWGGTRFSNVAAMFPAEMTQLPVVGLQTPDNVYHVSLDMDSMMHPQTLLTWDLNGAPLTSDHGAPIRLTTPLKYGIKQIKRIGRVQFSEELTLDYWEERGYDWYAGL